jgi:hypothetical protein
MYKQRSCRRASLLRSSAHGANGNDCDDAYEIGFKIDGRL